MAGHRETLNKHGYRSYISLATAHFLVTKIRLLCLMSE